VRLALFVLVAVLFIPAAAATVLADTVTTAVDMECPPGSFVYNASGEFICLPVVKEARSPFATMFAVLNDSGLYVDITCFESSGCNVSLEVDAPSGERVVAKSLDLAGGEVATVVVPVSGYSYLVIRLTVNGFEYGPYAVAKVQKSAFDVSSISPVSALLLMIAAASPLICVALRPSTRIAGAALAAVSMMYLPILEAFGIPPNISELITAIAFLVGIILAAVGR